VTAIHHGQTHRFVPTELQRDFQILNSKKERKRIRLSGYDYSQPGGYFVTICTNGRRILFGEVVGERMNLNHNGEMVEIWWGKIPKKFRFIKTDSCVIMPNHFHGIIMIEDYQKTELSTTWKGLPTILQWFKTMTTNAIFRMVNKANKPPYTGGKLWQRSYYDHIIRNDVELRKIRRYIINNPLKWHLDRENPESPNFELPLEKYFQEILELY
jgi:putative transposase